MKLAKNKKYNPKHFEWPRWSIRLFTWLSIIPLVFAFILFLLPQINDGDKGKYRIIIVIALVVAPVLIHTFLWIVKTLLVISKRTAFYPTLYNFYQDKCSRSLEVERQFASYISNSTKHYMFEISKTTYQKNQLYISLKKKERFDLNLNDGVIVIDINDWYYMGQFIVTEIRNDVYYAAATKLIDPLWLSFVRKNGEVEMTPNLIAYCEKAGEQDVQ